MTRAARSGPRESALRRSTQPMPGDVYDALARLGLFDRYRARPAHERNGYITWIATTEQAELRRSRIDRMCAELSADGTR